MGLNEVLRNINKDMGEYGMIFLEIITYIWENILKGIYKILFGFPKYYEKGEIDDDRNIIPKT